MILDGEVVEADPPRRLVQTFRALWSEDMAAEPPSRVTWEIEVDEQGLTQVTVTHDRLDEAPHTAEAISGWHYILSGLKTLLETGRRWALTTPTRDREGTPGDAAIPGVPVGWSVMIR